MSVLDGIAARMRAATLRAATLLVTTLLAACEPAPSPGMRVEPSPSPWRQRERTAFVCPTEGIPTALAAGTSAHHETAAFWLGLATQTGGRRQLLDDPQIASLNRTSEAIAGGFRDILQPAAGDPLRVQQEIEERRVWLHKRVASGRYVQGGAATLSRALARIAASHPVDRVHLVARETPLWCIPTDEGLYAPPIDLAFDRNRCASLHTGEAIRVLLEHTDGDWAYVHAGHSVGWIYRAPLTPALGETRLRTYLAHRPRVIVISDRVQSTLGADPPWLRLGSSFPRIGGDDATHRVLIPTEAGIVETTLPVTGSVARTTIPFTSNNVLALAFDAIGRPYGWGGRYGSYDCSRFLHDLFATFGIRLARNSRVQANLGSVSISLQATSEQEKREQIIRSAQSGMVLLYMPGHIMLYIGEDGDQMYAISAISEYLEPCREGQDITHLLGRVAVTTLELGRGTERSAFIERIDRIAVFGTPPA
ncbi:MAG: NlpC/P60 family protein [Nannocystaceae bacterium]